MSRALFAGVTGLNANAFALDVIGNNIANINTTGYKASRALFGDLLAQTISGGTASVSGGTAGINPIQVGTGVRVLGVDTDYSQGAFLTSGNVTDIAVSGSGFFVLNNGNSTVYTRDGAFAVDLDGSLISPFSGYRVQGWEADDNGNINVNSQTSDITIPLGSSTVANATSTLNLVGNLDSSGTTDGVGTTAFSGNIYAGAATNATSASLLTALTDVAGNSLNLEAGDSLSVSASKGTGALVTRTFTVGTTGTTLGDFTDFMQQSFGIVSDSNTAATEQVTVSGGQIAIQGNIGTANAITAITISGTDAGGLSTLNTSIFNSFFAPDAINGFTETSTASGESSFSQMVVYDSLGVGHTIDVIYSRADADENIWSFFAIGNDSFQAGSSGTGLVSTAGRLEFASSGAVSSFTGNSLSLELDNGATTPLSITVDGDSLTQFGTTSDVSLTEQDGFPPGVLESFTIAATGVVTGIFSNGLTKDLGQVALAEFTNEDGLIKAGDNLYQPGTNAGTPAIGAPGTGGRGSLNSGFLEQSNVDLARQFSNLIVVQRAYQASARTITAADALLAEAVNLV
jgi:flagellar hook protein FlgE